MPKGSKTCSNCGKTCGPRRYDCPHCSHAFVVKGEKKTPKQKIVRKKKPKIIRVVDWASLPTGTRFKVSSGSGPYYTTNNERTYISEKGYYNVHSIVKDGIMATGEHGAFTFIYMGDTKASPNIPNLTREAHRIYVKDQ
jgi:hypothetical protein